MTAEMLACHTITLAIPVRQCQRLFTPAGEELWVDAWQPRYLHPPDGSTVQGMIFLTGQAEETTTWLMTEFSQDPYRARYARVTPASRWGFVQVVCTPFDETTTQVEVTYAMHALSRDGSTALKGFESEPFVAMIEGWKQRIDLRLEALRVAHIR